MKIFIFAFDVSKSIIKQGYFKRNWYFENTGFSYLLHNYYND